MEKTLKNRCSLEEEYRFEHLARIKAEKYIKELWKYSCELQKEVSRLQSIINKGDYLSKGESLINDDLALKMKLEKNYSDRKKSLDNMAKIIEKVFK